MRQIFFRQAGKQGFPFCLEGFLSPFFNVWWLCALLMLPTGAAAQISNLFPVSDVTLTIARHDTSCQVSISNQTAAQFLSLVQSNSFSNPALFRVTNYSDSVVAVDADQTRSSSVGIVVTKLPQPIIKLHDGELTNPVTATIALGHENIGGIVEASYHSELGRQSEQQGFDFWVGVLGSLRNGGWTDEQLRAYMINSARNGIEYRSIYGAPGAPYIENNKDTIEYSVDRGRTWATYQGPVTLGRNLTIEARAFKDGSVDARTTRAFVPSDIARARFVDEPEVALTITDHLSMCRVFIHDRDARHFLSLVNSNFFRNPALFHTTNYSDSVVAVGPDQTRSTSVGIVVTELPLPVISVNAGSLTEPATATIALGLEDIGEIVEASYHSELERQSEQQGFDYWVGVLGSLRNAGWTDERLRAEMINSARSGIEYISIYGAPGVPYVENNTDTIEYSLDRGHTWTTYQGPVTVGRNLSIEARAFKDGSADVRTTRAFLPSDVARVELR